MFFRRVLRTSLAASLPAAAIALTNQASCRPAPTGIGSEYPPTVLHRTAEWPLRAGEPVPITLEYFAIRALGELPRLLLEVLEVPYDSVYHFGGGYYKPYAPFGQMPLYREGSMLLSQSGAICRHIANKFGIAGDCPASKAKVDMYFELAKDIKSKKSAIYDMQGHPDAAKLHQFLVPAEAACDGKFFVGKKLTLADVAMFEALHTMVELAPDSLDKYPSLEAFVATFAARPQVAAYLASERRLPLTPNETGKQAHSGIKGYALPDLNPKVYAEEWTLPYSATKGK